MSSQPKPLRAQSENMIISILSAVIIFAILIIVHETGHFVMAKRSGVRVIRYSVGYPPKLFGVRRGETEYAFGATPLGGYVRMLGDEVAEEPTAETLEGLRARAAARPARGGAPSRAPPPRWGPSRRRCYSPSRIGSRPGRRGKLG